MSSSQIPVQRQYSTHVMETTRSGRPFVKDLHNMLSALIISMPMETHRNSSGIYPNSFTTEEAIANLGSLKTIRSHRVSDQEDSTKIVTTTTITKFSMSKDTAKVACQTFLDARLFENLTDPSIRSFKDKSIYGLTSKGIYILERFLSVNNIKAPHLLKIFLSQSTKPKLFAVGRDHDTDSITLSKQNVDSIFRRFAGSKPNIINENSSNRFVAYNNHNNHLLPGIELKDHCFNDKKYRYTFSGKAAYDWLCSFTTLISKDETKKVITEFINRGFIKPIDDGDNNKDDSETKSVKQNRHPRCSEFAYYRILDKGRKIALWKDDHLSLIPSTLIPTLLGNEKYEKTINGIGGSLNENIQVIYNKESNVKKLQQILDDPNLCSLFMDFSKSILCEENLLFLLQVQKFKIRYSNSKNIDEFGESQKEREDLIADAFKIYDTYFAPTSPHELNIDFSLRQSMTQYMTSIVSRNDKESLDSITSHLYDKIQDVIYRLTAIDSVPKFIRTKEYLNYIQNNGSEVQ